MPCQTRAAVCDSRYCSGKPECDLQSSDGNELHRLRGLWHRRGNYFGVLGMTMGSFPLTNHPATLGKEGFCLTLYFSLPLVMCRSPSKSAVSAWCATFLQQQVRHASHPLGEDKQALIYLFNSLAINCEGWPFAWMLWSILTSSLTSFPRDLLLKHTQQKSWEGPWDSFCGTWGLVLELMSLLCDIHWYL